MDDHFLTVGRTDNLSQDKHASQNTITTYYTASEHAHASWLSENPHFSIATTGTTSTFYSIVDPAYPRVSSEEDFRVAFGNLFLTEHIRLDNTRPPVVGGYADVLEGEITSHSACTLLKVAVKVPRRSNSDPGIFRKLAREIAIWRTLAHPNILPLIGLYWDRERLPSIVSIWCKNGNAVSYVTTHYSQLNIYNIQLSLLTGALKGLIYLHDLAIFHGDLKGANILVDSDGTARLGDFGVSAVFLESPSRTATSPGTYRWMAPDLLTEHGAHSRQSDIWAFGCVILELITLQLPYFNIREDHRVIIALYSGQIPPRPPGISDLLWNLSTECFSLNPRTRPSAADLLPKITAASIPVMSDPPLRYPLPAAVPHHDSTTQHRLSVLVSADVWSYRCEWSDLYPEFRVYVVFRPITARPPLARHFVLFRTYQSFFSFSRAIAAALPGAEDRLPRPLPSPDSFWSHNPFDTCSRFVATLQCHELDTYVRHLTAGDPVDADYVLRHELVHEFFRPRSGDLIAGLAGHHHVSSPSGRLSLTAPAWSPSSRNRTPYNERTVPESSSMRAATITTALTRTLDPPTHVVDLGGDEPAFPGEVAPPPSYLPTLRGAPIKFAQPLKVKVRIFERSTDHVTTVYCPVVCSRAELDKAIGQRLDDDITEVYYRDADGNLKVVGETEDVRSWRGGELYVQTRWAHIIATWYRVARIESSDST